MRVILFKVCTFHLIKYVPSSYKVCTCLLGMYLNIRWYVLTIRALKISSYTKGNPQTQGSGSRSAS